MKPRSGQEREQELARKAKAGDSDAFGELVVKHQRVVFNIAYRLAGNREDAKDVTQEAFVRAFRKLDRFDPDRPFAPWLYRLATNTALNWLKRRRPEAHKGIEPIERGPGPAARLIAVESVSRLREAIGSLPLNQRAAIELRHFQGASYKEIGRRLNAPLSDVKSWLFRARRRLQRDLGNER
jgi:RNA polymerase sigma-70 factor (ECF subfamily)